MKRHVTDADIHTSLPLFSLFPVIYLTLAITCCLQCMHFIQPILSHNDALVPDHSLLHVLELLLQRPHKVILLLVLSWQGGVRQNVSE